MAGEIALLYYNVRDRSTQVHVVNGTRTEGLLDINKQIGVFLWHETHWMRAHNRLYGIVFYDPLIRNVRVPMGATQSDFTENRSEIVPQNGVRRRLATMKR